MGKFCGNSESNYFKRLLWGWEWGLWVKYLLGSCEDLSLNI